MQYSMKAHTLLREQTGMVLSVRYDDGHDTIQRTPAFDRLVAEMVEYKHS